MSLTQFTTDISYISALPDNPTPNGGYTKAQLKTEFDKAGNALKTFLNETMIAELDLKFTELNSTNANVQVANSLIGADGRTYENLPDRFDTIDAEISDNSISPEKFAGTDLQKLQQALDYAVTNSVAIRLRKMYDITGLGTLLINKTQNYSPNTNRKPLYIIGQGGGIKKTDSGYIFSAPLINIGDVFFDKVKFESIEGGGTTIFNGNKLINIFSNKCYYLNCDTIAEANESGRFAQGWNFDNNIIIGGNGWAFQSDHYWAFNFNKNIMEWREHGIKNSNSASQINHGVNIVDNTIEGLRGQAISINGTDALQLRGNYFEANTVGYVEIKSPCNGAEISNNFFFLLPDQITANMVCIALLSSGVIKSISNRSNGILYSMVAETTVYSDCDSAVTIATGTTTYLYVLKSTGGAVGYDATYGVSKRYGFATGLTLRKSVTFNTAGEIQKVDFVFADTIYADDIYSVQAQAVGTSVVTNMPDVMSFYRSGVNTLTAYVKNNYAGAISLTLTANVIKLGNLSYYG